MRIISFLLVLWFAGTGTAAAQTWEAGLWGGYRTIKDATLREVYGNGFVFSPYLSLGISPSLRIGAEYEGGYVKEARIGIFADPSTLDVHGINVFIQYGERSGRLQPYLKIGAGVFAYRLDIGPPSPSAVKVDDSDVSFFIGAGLRVTAVKRLFLMTEIKYAALWVDPFDDRVDLGGLRAMLGIGLGL